MKQTPLLPKLLLAFVFITEIGRKQGQVAREASHLLCLQEPHHSAFDSVASQAHLVCSAGLPSLLPECRLHNASLGVSGTQMPRLESQLDTSLVPTGPWCHSA